MTMRIVSELLSVTLPDATIAYTHDPLGRRIAKKVNGVITEKYLWQGLTRLLAVYDGNDLLLARFLYADGRMPVAMEQGGATYYLTYDQVGTLRVVADSSGNVVKRIDYDSFGNIINDTNASFEIPFGFAGGLHDRDTGLVRFGFRDYDPDTSRWTAKDPIRFAGRNIDLYGYALNDPVDLVDPDGLIVLYGGVGAGAGIGTGRENKPTYFTGTAAAYIGTSKRLGIEPGVLASAGAGKIAGVAAGGGLIVGFDIRDAEDISGPGASTGFLIGLISVELTFDENNKPTGIAIGLGGRGFGFGIFGKETQTAATRIETISPCY